MKSRVTTVSSHAIERYCERASLYGDATRRDLLDAAEAARPVPPGELLPWSHQRTPGTTYRLSADGRVLFLLQASGRDFDPAGSLRLMTVLTESTAGTPRKLPARMLAGYGKKLLRDAERDARCR